MMNKLSRGLWLAALCLSVSVSAKVGETPKDYAYGLPLTTQGSEPFFEVALPGDVYQQTAWPDMRDLRVFNSQGVTVPFALYSTEIHQTQSRTWPLRVFPLDNPQRGADGQSQITVKAANGIEVTLPAEGDKPSGRSLLLEVPQEGKTFIRGSVG